MAQAGVDLPQAGRDGLRHVEVGGTVRFYLNCFSGSMACPFRKMLK